MDLKFFKKSIPTLAIMGVFSVLMIYAIYSMLTPDKKLPVYNPADVNPKLVDESISHIRSNHKVSDFTLINQNGDTITQANYEGKIYVADFFFTRCNTICPVMTNNMGKLQEAFLDDDEVMFLSHSVTPDIDSVSVLRAYADAKGVIDAKWNKDLYYHIMEHPLVRKTNEPKRFYLHRIIDESGMSGVGRVAEGVELPDGTCVIWWL